MKLKSIEEVVKEFNNQMAMQLTPSNDTMHAVRLAKKMLTQTITERDQHLIQSIRKEVDGNKEVYQLGDSKWDKTKITEVDAGEEKDHLDSCCNETLDEILTYLTTLEEEVTR